MFSLNIFFLPTIACLALLCNGRAMNMWLSDIFRYGNTIDERVCDSPNYHKMSKQYGEELARHPGCQHVKVPEAK